MKTIINDRITIFFLVKSEIWIFTKIEIKDIIRTDTVSLDEF